MSATVATCAGGSSAAADLGRVPGGDPVARRRDLAQARQGLQGDPRRRRAAAVTAAWTPRGSGSQPRGATASTCRKSLVRSRVIDGELGQELLRRGRAPGTAGGAEQRGELLVVEQPVEPAAARDHGAAAGRACRAPARPAAGWRSRGSRRCARWPPARRACRRRRRRRPARRSAAPSRCRRSPSWPSAPAGRRAAAGCRPPARLSATRSGSPKGSVTTSRLSRPPRDRGQPLCGGLPVGGVGRGRRRGARARRTRDGDGVGGRRRSRRRWPASGRRRAGPGRRPSRCSGSAVAASVLCERAVRGHRPGQLGGRRRRRPCRPAR